MDRLARIGCYFRWMKGEKKSGETRTPTKHCRGISSDSETSKKIFSILESILQWENSVNSISVVVVFNILFWGIVVLEVRGFAAASSAALVVVLCYSTLEAQIEKEQRTSASTISQPKAEQIGKIICKAKSGFQILKNLRRSQPGVFCTGVCTASVALWMIGRAINGVLLTYAICMSILLGPALLLRIPSKVFATKEWDSEIEEFLPAVTKDNLEVLKRAGEMGDNSPTRTSSSSDFQNDPFNDDELIGLKMPSHEDGSTDGLELSELELSSGETDVDGIRIKSGHFERGSSSEEEAELEPHVSDIPSYSEEDSESEFEIIDSQEITDFGKL